jgi:PAS domain S-box-containing protein
MVGTRDEKTYMTAKHTSQQSVAEIGRAIWLSHTTTNLEILRPLLVRAVLFFLGLAAVANIAATPFIPRSDTFIRLGVSAAVLGAIPLVGVVERRWGIHVASSLLVVALWLVASFPVALRGVHSAGYSAYLLIIVIGVTLLGNRGGLLVTGASAVFGAMAVYMEKTGLLEAGPLDPILIWSAHLIFAVLITAVVSLAYYLLNSALKETRESEEQLTESNSKLSTGTVALHQANRAFQLISACNQAITRSTSIESILKSASASLVEVGNYKLSIFTMRSEAEPQTMQPVAHAGDLQLVGGIEGAERLFSPDSAIHGYTEYALQSGQPVIFPWPEINAVESRLPASPANAYCGLFPLIKDGTVAGILLVFSVSASSVQNLPLQNPPLQEEIFTAEEVNLLSDLAGDIAYGIVALRSITRQKEESARLKMSNELLTATLASIDHAVFVIEGSERIVRMCNAAAERIFGYKAEELIGQPISTLHRDQESYQAFIRNRAANLPNGTPYRTKLITQHRDGSQRYTDVTLTPLLHSMSMLAGEVSVVRDITEEHKREEQLKASEASYRDLFNSMREGFVLHEMLYDDTGQAIDYRFIEVNPAFETITGIKRDDVMGKTVSTLFPATAPSFIARFARVVETGEPVNGEELLSDLGKYVDFTAFRPRPGQFVVTFHDITDRRAAQRALEEERSLLAQRVSERTAELTQANADLAETARHKDEFLASVSHELRTPLNAILGITEAMSEEIYGPLNEIQQRKLHNIEESGHHLLTLINEVLDMAKIESGKLELEIEKVGIRMICEASLRLTRQAATQKRIHVDLQIDSSIDVIEADGRRLKQMLINLLGNAVKFTPEDKEIGLRVSSNDRQGVVHFTVWDTGIGIAPDQQKRLFKPFVQVDSKLTRQYNGTGLGLALVDKMAQLHGGTVSLESELGRGSEFTITLPVKVNRISASADANEEAASLSALADTPATAEVDAPTLQSPQVALSVLIADENEARAQSIAVYFADKGYHVQSVRNHTDTIHSVQEQYYHLIVIDLQTSNRAGVETIQQIRAEGRCRFSPIVALTGQPTPEERQQCQHVGATAYWERSGQSQSFFEAFEELLQRELLS